MAEHGLGVKERSCFCLLRSSQRNDQHEGNSEVRERKGGGRQRVKEGEREKERERERADGYRQVLVPVQEAFESRLHR